MDDNMDVCRNKMKVSRDPMSHRIIEKRRRDRMNSCLADLSRLIPTTYLKKGRGRIEKTEIIELAIKHLKQLQSILYNRKINPTVEDCDQRNFASKEQFYLGYQECLHETTCYLVESEGLLVGDQLCVRLLSHLKQHGETVCNKGHFGEPETNFIRRSNSVTSPESGSNSVGSFADADGGDSQHFVIKKSPATSPSQYVSSPTIEVDSSAYDCQQIQRCLTVNNVNVTKDENNYRWQHSELLESHHLRASNLDSEGDVGNIGGMSTCSRSSNRSDEVYKYKRNIKERFNADQKVKSVSDGEENDDFELDEDRKRRRKYEDSDENTITKKRKLSEIVSSDESEGTVKKMINNKEISDFEIERMRIPIFALHPKGSYYVPMTIDSSLILTQLNAILNFPSPLHHIGISVSFSSDFLALNSMDSRTK